MVVSWLDHEIVWLRIEGNLRADEIVNETLKWLNTRPNDYVGYIIDVRKMTGRSPLEEQKMEEAAKRTNSGKVRAVLGKDEAFSMIVKIYIRFTKAEGVRYFTDENVARAWVLSHKQLAPLIQNAP
jgi:hypothetical protein